MPMDPALRSCGRTAALMLCWSARATAMRLAAALHRFSASCVMAAPGISSGGHVRVFRRSPLQLWAIRRGTSLHRCQPLPCGIMQLSAASVRGAILQRLALVSACRWYASFTAR